MLRRRHIPVLQTQDADDSGCPRHPHRRVHRERRRPRLSRATERSMHRAASSPPASSTRTTTCCRRAFRTLPGTRGVPMARVAADDGRGLRRASGVDAELASVAASVGVAEGLLSGVTTVADHHLTWPAGCRHRRDRARDRRRGAGARRAARLRARLPPATTRRRPRHPPRRSSTRSRRPPGRRHRRRDAAGRGRPGRRAQRLPRDVRAARRGRRSGTGCAGARRPTSRSTSRSPSSDTAAARSTCSTSGAGSPPTSPSPTCAT